MLEVISVLLAIFIGCLLVRVLDPVRNLRPRWASAVFVASLGAGLGIGTTSLVFLLLDTSGLATPALMFGVEIVSMAVLGWQWWKIRARERVAISVSDNASLPAMEPEPVFRWTWLLVLAFSAVCLISWTRVIQMAAALPVGDWDAWAIWNLRAKFLAGPGDAWRYAVSPLLSNSHPDYPLLLPAFIGRVWKSTGTMDTLAPVLTSLLFFTALVALLVSAVALLRGVASAMLAGLVLLATTSLLTWAPAQYADIPLAFYILSASALIILDAASAKRHRSTLVCAGLCAGLAAYTKNEGIMFLALIVIVYFTMTVWRRGWAESLTSGASLVAGAVPGALLTVWFKLFLAPAVDPLVTQGSAGFGRLLDPARYALVAAGLFHNLLNLGSGVAHPLILVAILAVLVRWQMDQRYRLPSLIAAVTLLLAFLSYCGVYLITPYGLEWQVQSSFDRLILQLWPAALLVFFVQLRSIADSAPAVAVRSPAKAKLVGRSAKAARAGATPAGSKVK